MPITWDAEADRKLLLAIIECTNVSIDNAAVAKKMKQHDMECTPMAIQKRFQRIRTMIKDGSSTPNGAPKGTPKSKTPSKRKGMTDDDDDEEPQTPSKKSKTTKGKIGVNMSATPFEETDGDGKGDSVKKEEAEDGLN